MTSTSSTKKLDDSKQLDEFKQLIIDDKNFTIEVFCDYLQNVLESEVRLNSGRSKPVAKLPEMCDSGKTDTNDMALSSTRFFIFQGSGNDVTCNGKRISTSEF